MRDTSFLISAPHIRRLRPARTLFQGVSGLVLGLVVLPATAHAHLGHIGELGGHSHWAGIGLLAGAAALAGLSLWKGRKKKEDAGEEVQAEDEEGTAPADVEAEPA